jgi:hypothetical protein
MIKTGSLVALLLGIVLDIQGCGASCPTNDAVPATKDDCIAVNLALCMAADAVTTLTDPCDLMTAQGCCWDNCCDAPADIMSGMVTDIGDAETIKDVMKAEELQTTAIAKLVGCTYKNPCR